jgi:hypothetical protein
MHGFSAHQTRRQRTAADIMNDNRKGGVALAQAQCAFGCRPHTQLSGTPTQRAVFRGKRSNARFLVVTTAQTQLQRYVHVAHAKAGDFLGTDTPLGALRRRMLLQPHRIDIHGLVVRSAANVVHGCHHLWRHPTAVRCQHVREGEQAHLFNLTDAPASEMCGRVY